MPTTAKNSSKQSRPKTRQAKKAAEAQRLRVIAAINNLRAEAEAIVIATQQVWERPTDDELDDDGPQSLFSDAERASIEVSPAEEAVASVTAIREAFEPLERKSFDLYWIGRRCIADVQADPTHPSHSGVRQVLAKYPEEANKIADGDSWEHGYHAGMIAACRLVLGLASTEWIDFSEGTDDATRPWMSPAAERRQALEDFPMLDS